MSIDGGGCLGSGGGAAKRNDCAPGGDSFGYLDALTVGEPAVLMLSISPATRIFIALEPVDLRQSFNGLHARVQSVLQQDPLSGHVFLFTNKHHNRVKLVFFDGSGLWVCAKRLERGTFGWPKGEGHSCCLRPEELSLLLHG